nr:hypothetical protein [Cryobacterium zongtaii]
MSAVSAFVALVRVTCAKSSPLDGAAPRSRLSLVVGLAVAADLRNGATEIGANVVSVDDPTESPGPFGAPAFGVLAADDDHGVSFVQRGRCVLPQLELSFNKMRRRIDVLDIPARAVLPRVLDDSKFCDVDTAGLYYLDVCGQVPGDRARC